MRDLSCTNFQPGDKTCNWFKPAIWHMFSLLSDNSFSNLLPKCTDRQTHSCNDPAWGERCWLCRISPPLWLLSPTTCQWPGSRRTGPLSTRSGWEGQRWTGQSPRPAGTSPCSCLGCFCKEIKKTKKNRVTVLNSQHLLLINRNFLPWLAQKNDADWWGFRSHCTTIKVLYTVGRRQ